MLIEMKHITKTYGNVIANDDVSLHLNDGEILAVVGENGAGKSTLMKILYGLEQPDAGEIWFQGQKCRIDRAMDAIRLGIGMVQQHFMLFESMTVAENIVYGHEVRKGIFLDSRAANKKVRQLSEQYGLPVNPEDRIADLSIGLQQRVEILKILYQQSKIIIFDEPTAVLTPLEAEELLKTIRQLKEAGKSIILITHKLQEVMDVSDRIVVMRSGKTVYETKTGETNIEELAMHMVGHRIPEINVESQPAGQPLLQVKDLTVYSNADRPAVDHVSFTVRAGEIVGIAGVSGNGQSELIRAVTGLLKTAAGTIELNGQDVTNASVYRIRNAGLSHVPEDRYFWGSAKDATLAENCLMGYQHQAPYERKGILKSKAIQQHASDLIRIFSVKADGIQQKMRELSGGNAQKLIVAREITNDAKVLVVAEPTRGIDIGASDFIHEQLLNRRREGYAILLMSSDLTEIMTLCDRIHIMFEGRINRTFQRGEADAKTLGLYMVRETAADEK